MSKVNKKNIEKIFYKIEENFNELEYREQLEVLMNMEKKATMYNGEDMSDMKAIEIAFDKVKYHFARIYSEGKAKSTLVNLKNYIDLVESGCRYIKTTNYWQQERAMLVIRDLITYLEINLNLDISFYTSLLNLYHECLEKDNLSFNNVAQYSERRKNR